MPIIGLLIILNAYTIVLAGKRNLGGSIFADKDTSMPHTMLLNSPLMAAIRLIRSTAIGWLIGVGLISTFFDLLAKSAAQAFSDSTGIKHAFRHLAHASQQAGAVTFLGAIFLILIILIMACVASAAGAIREEEAEGYLDNFLVRPIGRLQWISGRIILSTLVNPSST